MDEVRLGVDLKTLIREHLMFLLGVPFKKSEEVTTQIIQQCERSGWIEVVGDSEHVVFERVWSKEQERRRVWREGCQ